MDRTPFLRRRMAPDPPPAAATPEGHAGIQTARETRWRSGEYADTTKLREIAARHQRAATKNQTRSARLLTRIEKLRHQATVLREKAQLILQKIPGIEQEIAQHQRDIDSANKKRGTGPLTSDVTNLHFRVRKLQQKIVDLQHKSRTLEHRAAQKTQKTAELKVRSDRFVEQARVEELEASSYTKRADRLQLENEGAAPPPAEGPRDATGPA